MNLYPAEGAHWWSWTDHRTVVEITRRMEARRVLEFGPGTSTLSLIEGGALYIDACEDDPEWFATYCDRIEDRFPHIVQMQPYTWTPDLVVNGVAGWYDLALIDGPREVARRPAVINYCLARCNRVLVPLEEGDDHPDNGLRAAVAAVKRRPIEYIDSGPLAGTFALIGPPC